MIDPVHGAGPPPVPVEDRTIRDLPRPEQAAGTTGVVPSPRVLDSAVAGAVTTQHGAQRETEQQEAMAYQASRQQPLPAQRGHALDEVA
jgi:hypothetical protein